MYAENRNFVTAYKKNCDCTQEKQTFQGIKTSHCLVLLVVITFLAYSPVFGHKFQMRWDDWWVVMNDYTEGGFNWSNIGKIISDFFHGQYAPVNEFFYLTLYTAFGYNPFWFHTASLLIHVGNVLLVFFLIQRLLERNGLFRKASVIRISLITGVLMAIHPMTVEAVAWMAASKCILFAFFYLLALHFYISYISSQRISHFIGVFMCFVLSFGSKEQAVTLPACLLLLDYMLKRNMRSSGLWLEKLPLFIVSGGFIIITFYSQQFNGEGILSKQPLHAWYQNIAFAAYSVAEYVIKCLLPVRLSYIYPFPNLPGQPMPLYLWIYPLMILFVTIAFWKFWKQRWNLFGMVFFLIQASVVCNLIPTSRFAIIADRYIYLPAVGVFFLIAYYTDLLLQKRTRFKNVILYGSAVYVLCLGVYANQRCKVWHDSDTLKIDLIKVLKSRDDYKQFKQNL